MTTETKSVDVASLNRSPFSRLIGEALGGPLVVDIKIEDGQIDPDSIRALGNAMAERFKGRGVPEHLLEELKGKIEAIAKDPDVLDKARAESWKDKRAEALGNVRAARKLLEDVPDTVLDIAHLRSKIIKDHDQLARTSYKLGNINSSAVDIMRLLSDVEEGLTHHDLTCECVDEHAHVDVKAGPAPEGT